MENLKNNYLWKEKYHKNEKEKIENLEDEELSMEWNF